MQHFTVALGQNRHPTRDFPVTRRVPSTLPDAKTTKLSPFQVGGENASIYFVGTATTIIEWEGIRIMTDPNFLHKRDCAKFAPLISSSRKTNPAVDLHELPRIDLVLLSHYHGDHFDKKVEDALRRDLPIITTPQAKSELTSKGNESFTRVYHLEPLQGMMVDVKWDDAKQPRIRITAMPARHVPGRRFTEKLNNFAAAIPPTTGWMLELGYGNIGTMKTSFTVGYRIYITGDTLMSETLKEIPERYAGKKIDLMLAHLGGTTLPTPALSPMTRMTTMDAKQGVELMQLIKPDVVIPIHYGDYEAFASSLGDFRAQVDRAGLGAAVVYLEQKDQYRFRVREESLI
ncbi:hypothetical protein MW887_008902 [Aspergillus wentii]|nr:hypothetical protein MW887_008902 [Aspergillus wentii]